MVHSPAEVLNALCVLDRTEPDIDWDPFVEAAGNQLRDGIPSLGSAQQPTPSESQSLLGILAVAQQHSLQARAALVEEGIALEYVWLASEQGDDGALGDWLYEEIRQFAPESWNSRSHSGYAPSGKNLDDSLLADPLHQPVVPLAQTIERRSDFHVIATIGANVEGEALAAALVAELWRSDHFTAALEGDLLRSLWPHIERAGASGALDTGDLVGAVCVRPALVTELDLRVGEISERRGRGRHTTVASALYRYPDGGYVADTPGLQYLALWGLDPAELPGGFVEIATASEGCRFADCRHRVEPDCAVRAAVEEGTIRRRRLESYLRILDEAEKGR